MMRTRLTAIAGLIGVGMVGRLAPHLPNMTPVTAVTLAAQKHVGRAAAIAVPLCVMLLSDLLIGLYDVRVLASVYGSFALIGLASRWMPKSTAGASLFAAGSSVGFYLTTNMAVWFTSAWYPKTAAGLLMCYTLGLPFLYSMLIGDVLYTTLLFSAADAVVAIRDKSRRASPSSSMILG